MPEAVREFTHSFAGVNYVEVTWAKPFRSNGILTGYLIDVVSGAVSSKIVPFPLTIMVGLAVSMSNILICASKLDKYSVQRCCHRKEVSKRASENMQKVRGQYPQCETND